MGVNFLTERSRIVISAPAPLGALGSYLFNSQCNSMLSRSLLIRKEIDRRTTKVYVNVEGYTEAYDNLCVAMSRTIGINTAGAIEALRGTGTAGLMIFKQVCRLAALTIIPKD